MTEPAPWIMALREWLTEHGGDQDAPLFPTPRGELSRDAIEHRLAHYARQAADRCPSLHGKTITAHAHRPGYELTLIADRKLDGDKLIKDTHTAPPVRACFFLVHQAPSAAAPVWSLPPQLVVGASECVEGAMVRTCGWRSAW